ncbi:MAG: hypothetical protein IJS08_14615 [Victivallales bacterium]|nr:hypothetical protein [Victivallales bacterium]
MGSTKMNVLMGRHYGQLRYGDFLVRRMFGLMFAALLIGFLWSSEIALPDLSVFSDKTGLAEPVFEEDFEKGDEGWLLRKGFSVVKGAGVNGSTAMCYERDDSTLPYVTADKRFNPKPNVRYQVKFSYRVDFTDADNGVANKTLPGPSGMRIHAIRPLDETNKPLTGLYVTIPQPRDTEWHEATVTVVTPNDMKNANFELVLIPRRTGKVYWDNISVRACNGETCAVLHPVLPRKLALDEEGTVKFKTLLDPGEKYADYAVLLTVGSVKKLLSIDEAGFAEGKFGLYKQYKIPFEALLLNMRKKCIIARDKGNFFRKTFNAAKTNVEFDEDGFLLVNGKPFLPIGLFIGHLEADKENVSEALKRIADAGFNVGLAIGYEPNNCYGGVKANRKATLLASLDELDRHGLKFIFNIRSQIMPPRPFAYRTLDEAKTPEAVTRLTVNTLKNHPALLGWYVSDEYPIDDVPSIRELRETISELDQAHPILTLTDIIAHFPLYSKTGDIILSDAYPVGYKEPGEKQDMKEMLDKIRNGVRTGLPYWNVSQIFAWRACWPHKFSGAPRYPTEEEIRSMILISTTQKVRGYMFYNYSIVRYYTEKVDPDHFKLQWDNIAPAVLLLKELSPFILSKEKAPEAKVTVRSGNEVQALAMKLGGDVRVVIAAVGPDASEAEVYVPGCPNLKSKYGHTENLGGGRYLFKGMHISSDVLE